MRSFDLINGSRALAVMLLIDFANGLCQWQRRRDCPIIERGLHLDKDGGQQAGVGERKVIDRGPLEHVFGFLLRAAWRDSARVFAKYFRALDINPQQYATLILISRNPGCATGDLTDPLGVTPNNMVKLIETLSDRGLVEKTVDADDRRVRLLRLTAQGTAFLAQLFEIHEHYDAEFRAKLGADNITKLCEILHRFD